MDKARFARSAREKLPTGRRVRSACSRETPFPHSEPATYITEGEEGALLFDENEQPIRFLAHKSPTQNRKVCTHRAGRCLVRGWCDSLHSSAWRPASTGPSTAHSPRPSAGSLQAQGSRAAVGACQAKYTQGKGASVCVCVGKGGAVHVGWECR